MFDRIKRVFSGADKDDSSFLSESGPGAQEGLLSEWAASKGISYVQGSGGRFSLSGNIVGKPWRIEVGTPSRHFIHGEELRARAELGLNDDLAVVVMNRPLKETLERMAYSSYTDDTQTMAGPSLPEEARWLAVYPEVGWDTLPRTFWGRYAVLSNRREHALAWIDPTLARQLMEWPRPALRPEVPFALFVMRGKAYLRMQCESGEPSTIKHATAIFTSACDGALSGLSGHKAA